MSSFFDRLFGKEPKPGNTRAMAKERLQFILVHDRINLPPERLEEMKAEILRVISKYVSVDSDHVDIALQKRERSPYLVAEIPFQKTVELPDDDPPPATPPAPAAKPDEKKPQ
jgi:cell division topological specificity factor